MTILASSTQNLFSILNPFVQFFLSIAPQKPSCMKDICLPNKVHVIACNDSPPFIKDLYNPNLMGREKHIKLLHW